MSDCVCLPKDATIELIDANLGEKTITENGRYLASSDDLDGYSAVDVNVSQSFTQEDEGKVVSNGALVAQTAHADVTPTTSDQTIDTTTNNSIKVKGDADLVAGNIKKDVEIFGVTGSYEGGGGGGISVDGIAYGNEPSGAITITATGAPTIRQYAFNRCQNITAVTIQGSPYVSNSAFRECTGITTLNAPDLTRLYSSNYNTAQYVFASCSSLQTVVLPNYGNYAVDSYNFQSCTSLKVFDIANTNKLGNSLFGGCSNLDTLVFRKSDSVPQLTATNAFNNTPFASGGTGGTLYVPNSLISSYQSASNWSTILGYANNQIKSIESTHTDPNAPIDLTTHYADGTVIS